MKLYSNISVIFCIWSVSILSIFYLGFFLFPNSGSVSTKFIERLGNWDGGHFVNIGEFGYRDNSQYVFFPLYPLLINILSKITHNYLISGLLINIVSSFLSIQLLYRLILRDFGKDIAKKTILMLLFFPTSFFLLTTYSEGLFLFFAISTFYFLRQNKIALATLTCALASATRLAGIALFIAIIFDFYSRGINKKNWYLIFGILGFSLYCWFLFVKTTDPFYFITAESNWKRFIAIPGLSFWEVINKLFEKGLINKAYFNSFIELIFATFGLGMSIRVFRFMPPAFGIYSFLSMILPLLSNSLTSVPRFILPIFPIFVLIAQIKKENILLLYQLLSILLLSAFSILYINGFWVS